MADVQKIADEIKSKGFTVAKGDMNDERPDEWFLFGVWFYLKQNFYVDLDWRIGKYYFYLESAKEAVEAKEPKNKSLDTYSAVEYLKNGLLKNYNTLDTIANIIISEGFFATNDTNLIELFEEEDNKAVLFWISDELGVDALQGFLNSKDHLLILTSVEAEEKAIDYAKSKGYETMMKKLDTAFDDDDIEEEKIVGFDDVDFFF